MSAAIIPFLEGASFSPEMTQAMGEAYDRACKSLRDKGQPDVVQAVIAQRIIAIAKTGERDPDQICGRVLKSFGLDHPNR